MIHNPQWFNQDFKMKIHLCTCIDNVFQELTLVDLTKKEDPRNFSNNNYSPVFLIALK